LLWLVMTLPAMAYNCCFVSCDSQIPGNRRI
jgi:hypothetical protein